MDAKVTHILEALGTIETLAKDIHESIKPDGYDMLHAHVYLTGMIEIAQATCTSMEKYIDACRRDILGREPNQGLCHVENLLSKYAQYTNPKNLKWVKYPDMPIPIGHEELNELEKQAQLAIKNIQFLIHVIDEYRA